MDRILKRFLNYVAIETQADASSSTYPSNLNCLKLTEILENELKELGVEVIVEHGYVFGYIRANTTKKVPKIAFLAHQDTATDMTSLNVKPQIIKNYDGLDIKLNEEYTLSPNDFPSLNKYVGQTLITTDGTTLLGADDKAGIAIIMEMVERLLESKVEHGELRIGFTVDEEIGQGTIHFDVEKFDADYGYTIDGGVIGEIQYENFNAASMEVIIKGRNVHPGTAKNQMTNSLELAMDFNNSLPKYAKPEYTDLYEGFYHLMKLTGTVEKSELYYIIRDHDDIKFEKKKKYAYKVAEELMLANPNANIEVHIKDQYFNMKNKIDIKIVNDVIEAMKELNIEPNVEPIRGGTDGSVLSFKGLPCPNIFTGGHNFHGRFEYVCLESMNKSVEVLLKVIEKSIK